MRDCVAGRKLLFKLKDLVPVNVPRMNEFCADAMYKAAIEDPVGRRYLPDPIGKNQRRPVGRKFLFNVSECYRLTVSQL